MEYFTFKEFTRSQLAESEGIDNTLTGDIADSLYEVYSKLLLPIRLLYGKKIRINSGYRCPRLNALCGGSSTSAHLLGYAVDISPFDGDILGLYSCVLQVIQKVPFDQVIFENCRKGHLPSWIHLGLYNSKYEQRREILREYKGHYTPCPNFPYE